MRAFNALTLLSVVLCVATVVLWFTQPHVTIRDQPVERNPGWDGRVAYGVYDGRFFVGRYWRSHDGSIYNHLAFDVWAPCWLVLTGTAALPVAQGAAPRLREAEAALIRKAVFEARGNVAEAARVLGISRATVYRKLGVQKGH